MARLLLRSSSAGSTVCCFGPYLHILEMGGEMIVLLFCGSIAGSNPVEIVDFLDFVFSFCASLLLRFVASFVLQSHQQFCRVGWP